MGELLRRNWYSFLSHEELPDVKGKRSRLQVAQIEAIIDTHTEADVIVF